MSGKTESAVVLTTAVCVSDWHHIEKKKKLVNCLSMLIIQVSLLIVVLVMCLVRLLKLLGRTAACVAVHFAVHSI